MNSIAFPAKITAHPPAIQSREKGVMAQKAWEIFGECDIEISIKKIQPGKSKNQLGYFFAGMLNDIYRGFRELGFDTIYVPTMDADGYLTGQTCQMPITPERVRQNLKLQFCDPVPHVNRGTGEVLGMRLVSFADFTHEEMGEFIEKCIHFAAEDLGVTIQKCNSELAFDNLTQSEQ